MRVGIIGFGFSGLMVVANLVRKASAAFTVYIVAQDASGLGVAYATTNSDHLLNVPAGKMGAFEEDIGDFMAWLSTAEGARAQQTLGVTGTYHETDFVPRMLFGAYLQDLWRDTQALAAEKGIHLKLVPSDAVAVTPGDTLAILTQRGDAIAVDRVVLAPGHEIKPALPHIASPIIIQNPWESGIFANASQWSAPVLLMGTGLTMVDTVIMLRTAGYGGDIVAYSRHGLLPQPHAPQTSVFRFTKEQLLLHKNLQQLFHYVRTTIRMHGDWRVVVDALRPHTQALWQKLTTADQLLFLKRLGAYWSVHRHRMAPAIAARMHAQMNTGTLQLLASKTLLAELEENHLRITITDHEGVPHSYTPSHLINCTGPELNVGRSSRMLIKQALADGLIEMHATGVGIATDPQCRAWGVAYPHVYAVGSLMTGQLLESTAVPELRSQAAAVAENLTR